MRAKPSIVTAAATLAALALSGPATAAPGQVRFVHGVTELGTLDAYVDGRKVDRLTRGEIGVYARLASGSHRYQLRRAGRVRYSGTFVLPSAKARTLVVSGTTWKLNDQVRIVKDRSTRPFGVGSLRIAHRSPDGPALDVWAQAAGSSRLVRIVRGASYPRDADVLLAAGRYTLRVRRPGSSRTLLTVRNVVLAAGDLRTVWLLGSFDRRPRELAFSAATSTEVLPAAWDQAWVRVANATTLPAPLKICLGSATFATLGRGTARPPSGLYKPLPAGSRRVAVVAAAQACAVASPRVATTVALPRQGAVTLAVFEDTASGPGALGLATIADDITRTPAGRTRVRVVNLAVGAGPAQASFGTRTAYTGLGYAVPSEERLIAAGPAQFSASLTAPVAGFARALAMPANTATTVLLLGDALAGAADPLTPRSLALRSRLQ